MKAAPREGTGRRWMGGDPRSSLVTKGLKANLGTELWYSAGKEAATNLS